MKKKRALYRGARWEIIEHFKNRGLCFIFSLKKIRFLNFSVSVRTCYRDLNRSKSSVYLVPLSLYEQHFWILYNLNHSIQFKP